METYAAARAAARRGFGHDASAVVRPRDILVDLGLAGGVFAVFFGAVVVARAWSAPIDASPALDLDPARLPAYTLYSFARGVAAFVLSILFTLTYGKLAANPRAERVLIPLLDVLQSIPVLSFMPGFVIALMGLFPGSNLGLELACILAIFTGQVWNLTFSFHAALKTLPTDLVEAAKLNGFGPIKRMVALEVPSAMTGLVWNGMVSMAGGWFFIAVVEAFTIDGRSFRLPGLGSYMAAAVAEGDGRAMMWAVVSMVAMITALDQLVWRPLLAWAERFRHDDAGSGDPARSWLYDALRRSPLSAWLRRRAAAQSSARARRAAKRAATDRSTTPVAPDVRRPKRRFARAGLGVLVVCGAAFTLFGGYALGELLLKLPLGEWPEIARSFGYTAVRVAGALALGVLWAVPAGIVIGRSRRLSRIFQPAIQIAASFPAPMLYPLLVPLLMHAGLPANVIAAGLMTLGTQWYLLFNAAAGAASTPRDLREAAEVFRVPTPRRFLLVELGSVLPYVTTGLVAAAGGAWNASIVSEVVKLPGGEMRVSGIGAYIDDAFSRGDHPRLAAAVTALALALVLLNRFAWRPLQRLAATRFSIQR